MTIRVAINHLTRYQFDRTIEIHSHVVRLRPAAHCRTPILSYALKVQPESHFINWQQDPFGNFLARLVFPEKSNLLQIEVDLIAELSIINPFDFFLEEEAELFPFKYESGLRQSLSPYLQIVEDGPLLRDWLKLIPRTARRTIDFLVELNGNLRDRVDYRVRMEPGVQSCEETLGSGSGSCRDSGWLLVQILRHMGLAARFVSGYLVQLTADQKALDGPSGPDTDFTDLHAWAEVYLPGAGWIGLDPTSGLFAGEGHIPLSCTPTPGTAAPISGSTEPCEVEFEFHNRVQRIHEDPRVTKPYDAHQWAAMDALGLQVDEVLEQQDVRLTMGGEPTFVSIDDVDAPEWNSAADGKQKRELSHNLMGRLWQEFGSGGMLHHGEGKWYPGEALPRWQIACFWRNDGIPVWRNPALLTGITAPDNKDLGQARQFARALAAHLGISSNYLQPAFEDSYYFLWLEGTLPDNIDPARADLNDSQERRALARQLDRGLNEPAGFVLPIAWDHKTGHWRSSHWPLRRERLYLTPGASPMGLRLPLDALPEPGPDEETSPPDTDLFAPDSELGDYFGEVTRRYSRWIPPLENPDEQPQKPGDDPDRAVAAIVRTALCVELREGRIHLFLPPLKILEHYLELISAAEASAERLGLSLVLEGYEPPRDNRLQRLLVTPDPGVIEVNIHPAASWAELRDQTLKLYDLARESRLTTEKFMLDGRHSGTGGGNHITVGAATPTDSPMLRRPDLLRSLITYWQHHPGLSYLFSGMFIGPTSQAPRIDEARLENLYELEVAFQQMPEGEVQAPWLVDRLLRHLLVDLTGNTHRAEFCIDKLYSPDSATGRLGLLELRAFEMPPHAHMSLFQNLLLRALIARFWKAPYRGDLIRWGTELHDRFMLPHFVISDVREVLAELRQAGFPFQDEWLDPFFEFRFPRYGTVNHDGIELELRFAIEPWHVLGEEMSGSGTARYVDSSMERLQIKASGLTEGRHVLSCNGRRVPLRAAGGHGQQVAGVRYRAWAPPSALHPTIGIHSPLVFDIIDTWNRRSIGGCTYHVTHPGGRNYETFPINAHEAEGRRIMRFWNEGHSSGAVEVPPTLASLGRFLPGGSLPGPAAPPTEEPTSEFGVTLDLRRTTN
ncbi:MAG: transglutaminase family protein [Gammaproteobacteria bacterium]|nr:transglutaminase family protein [Gammaproteobacteria bacterium]